MNRRPIAGLRFIYVVLASLGVEIGGNRLGLGVNLFSNEQTLAEKYGYEDLFYELDCRSDFYNYNIFTDPISAKSSKS